jgi:hypothetical protein
MNRGPHAEDDNEPVPRRPIINIPKLITEGTPAEIQIVLGWQLDSHRLMVALPNDKLTAWSGVIKKFIEKKSVQRDELKSLLGRLNHAAVIMPLARHFLGRLRCLLESNNEGYKYLSVRGNIAVDLALWLQLLEMANKGLSIQLDPQTGTSMLVGLLPIRNRWIQYTSIRTSLENQDSQVKHHLRAPKDQPLPS